MMVSRTKARAGFVALWTDPATGRRRQKTLTAKTPRDAEAEAGRLADVIATRAERARDAAIIARLLAAERYQLQRSETISHLDLARELDISPDAVVDTILHPSDGPGVPFVADRGRYLIEVTDLTAWLARNERPRKRRE